MNCILCRLPLQLAHHGVCSQCMKNLPFLNKVCTQCGLPHSLFTTICYRCREKKPCWDEMISVSDYINPLKKLIHYLKFQYKVELSYPLARIMFLAWYQKWLNNECIKPDIVTCVPLHHIRYWSRGFNQSELLAKHIANWLERPFHPHLLTRKKHSLDQKKLSLNARESNVQSLFNCHKKLLNKSVMIIDDIVTTGNTINAISQQLRNCGVTHIQVICLCRTVL